MNIIVELYQKKKKTQVFLFIEYKKTICYNKNIVFKELIAIFNQLTDKDKQKFLEASVKSMAVCEAVLNSNNKTIQTNCKKIVDLNLETE